MLTSYSYCNDSEKPFHRPLTPCRCPKQCLMCLYLTPARVLLICTSRRDEMTRWGKGKATWSMACRIRGQRSRHRNYSSFASGCSNLLRGEGACLLQVWEQTTYLYLKVPIIRWPNELLLVDLKNCYLCTLKIIEVQIRTVVAVNQYCSMIRFELWNLVFSKDSCWAM